MPMTYLNFANTLGLANMSGLSLCLCTHCHFVSFSAKNRITTWKIEVDCI